MSLRVESTWNEQSDPLAPFVVYWKARFVDDPHMWASALFDEVLPLGYGCSYPSFARQVRGTIEIAHPAGEEIQWDWAERRNAPWGATSYGLLGTLSPGASRWTLVCATHRRTPVTTRLASGLGRGRSRRVALSHGCLDLTRHHQGTESPHHIVMSRHWSGSVRFSRCGRAR